MNVIELCQDACQVCRCYRMLRRSLKALPGLTSRGRLQLLIWLLAAFCKL